MRKESRCTESPEHSKRKSAHPKPHPGSGTRVQVFHAGFPSPPVIGLTSPTSPIKDRARTISIIIASGCSRLTALARVAAWEGESWASCGARICGLGSSLESRLKRLGG